MDAEVDAFWEEEPQMGLGAMSPVGNYNGAQNDMFFDFDTLERFSPVDFSSVDAEHDDDIEGLPRF